MSTFARQYTPENGTLEADKTTAKSGETVTLTVSPDGGYALEELTVTDASGASVTVNSDNTFTMPASNVTVSATFKALPKIGVDITWGAMKFTYSDVDNAGWTAEGNTVTVKLNENNSVANVSVEAAFTFTETATSGESNTVDISTLDVDYNWTDSKYSAILNTASDSCTFALNLTGTPTAAFSGKVGEVTLTITEAQAVTITTLSEFNRALSAGGSYKFGAAITASSSITASQNVTFDLNGYTFTNSQFYVKNGGNVTLLGGTFDSWIFVYENSSLTIKDGTYGKASQSWAVNVSGGTLTIVGDPTFSCKSQALYWSDGTIDLSGYTGGEIKFLVGDSSKSVSGITLPDGYGIYNYYNELLDANAQATVNGGYTIKPIEE